MLDVVEFSRAFIQGNAEYLASAKEVFLFLAPGVLGVLLHDVLPSARRWRNTWA